MSVNFLLLQLLYMRIAYRLLRKSINMTHIRIQCVEMTCILHSILFLFCEVEVWLYSRWWVHTKIKTPHEMTTQLFECPFKSTDFITVKYTKIYCHWQYSDGLWTFVLIMDTRVFMDAYNCRARPLVCRCAVLDQSIILCQVALWHYSKRICECYYALLHK